MRRTAGPTHQPPCGPVPWSAEDRDGPDRGGRRRTGTGPRAGTRTARRRDDNAAAAGAGPGFRAARPPVDQARVVARRLAAAGKPVSRRALRCGGVKGSNEALNALARLLSSEIAGAPPPRAPAG